MNDKQLAVKLAELDVREQLTQVRDAKTDLDEGYKRFKAKFDLNYAVLKSEYERQQILLEQKQAYLENAKFCAVKQFD